MKKSKNSSAQAAALRRLAERRLREQKTEEGPPEAEQDTLRLLHELQVHQVELEMQNEELVAARSEIEAGLERYTDLYDFAPVGYFTLGPDGTIGQVNITGASLLGIERSKLVRRNLGRFLAPDESGQWDQHFQSVLQSAEKQTCELMFKRADGSKFCARLESIHLDRPAQEAADGDSSPVIRVAMSDISDRKQIDDAQQFLLLCGSRPTGEDFFKSLARYLAQHLGMDFVCIDRLMGDGLAAKTVAIYDDGQFQNNVNYTLKDTPCGDVVGKTICCFPKAVRQLFPKDEVLQKMMAESYVGTTLWSFDGKPIGLIAVIGRKPLASTRLAESVLKLVAVRAAGELERKQIEMDLQRANDGLAEVATELERSNKDLEQFAYIASHDLQEPLRMVSGFLQILQSGYQDKLDAKANEYINFARDGAQRMSTMVTDLLAYSRVGRTELVYRSIDLRMPVRLAISMLRRSVGESGAKITIGDLPTVKADSGQIAQVFQNFLANAIKFHSDRSLEIEIGSRRDGDSWVIWLKDNGIGLDVTQSHRIFEMFQRLHPIGKYPGSGIGLAICKKIVERHGGRIWVESSPGEGSTFCFTIRAGGEQAT
jgi:PAS domain S-box-containing protein